ncbi:MAG TPA: zonular occludens toxin domain-containing protein, partial [Candidatus Synoicihabitans sp.]|nr:zonular occludens toxin domain-containing protein [Candidatus Synoicihabitans sp.]
ATMKILRELAETDRFIVTNIPLHPDKVHAFVTRAREKRMKPDEWFGPEYFAFNFDERVRVIKDQDVMEFYRFRAGGLVLPPSPDFECEVKERMPRLEFMAQMKENFLAVKAAPEFQRRPVTYYIDEAHNYFSSREWAQTGRGLLYYASQHRHLHDEIFLITQVLDNVETQMRRLVSETHVVRNQLRRRLGPWKLRPVFRVRHFYGTPSGGAATQAKPYDTSVFHLDPAGVAGCYQTVGALGVHTKPEVIKNKGLPWWTMYAALGAGCLLLGGLFFGVPMAGGRMAASMVDPNLGRKPTGGQSAPGPVSPSSTSQLEDAPQAKEESKTAAPWVLAAFLPPMQFRVLLSDGRVLTIDDVREFRFREWILTEAGERIQWRRPITAPVATLGAQ